VPCCSTRCTTAARPCYVASILRRMLSMVDGTRTCTSAIDRSGQRPPPCPCPCPCPCPSDAARWGVWLAFGVCYLVTGHGQQQQQQYGQAAPVQQQPIAQPPVQQEQQQRQYFPIGRKFGYSYLSCRCRISLLVSFPPHRFVWRCCRACLTAPGSRGERGTHQRYLPLRPSHATAPR